VGAVIRRATRNTAERRRSGSEKSKAVSRRAALAALGAVGVAVAAACGDSPAAPSGGTTSGTGATVSANGTCAVTPTETVGPYPSRADFIRSDVREGKPGTQLTLTIKVVNVNAACAPLTGADVEIWHVDAAGDYSQYGSQTAATFLRGIQTTNAAGEVTFVTIYPGWYQGRATHIHAEVTLNGRSVKVTQMAFPEATNNAVHTSGVYASRGVNPMSNLADGIFADSLAAELATPLGSPSGGYAVTFQIGVAT
jgi:protocatechuate 3,4-dioxygenase beta subunit